MFELLELACRRITHQKCIDLLIDYPEKLKNLIEQIYEGTPTVWLVTEAYINPVLLEISKPELVRELVELFLNNPKEFTKKLKELLPQL